LAVLEEFQCLFVKILLELFKDLRDFDCHGAVEKGYNIRDPFRTRQAVEVIQQVLGPLNGKGGDQDVPASLYRVIDDLAEFIINVLGTVVVAISVGGLHDHVIGMIKDRGIVGERLVPLADVPREDDVPRHVFVLDDDFNHGRAEDVAGIVETDLDLVIQRERFFIVNILQEGETLLGILDSIQWDFKVGSPSAFLVMAFFLESSIFFLHSSRIQNHDRKQRFGCGGQQDVSGKPFLNELGDQPGVVQVDMGEKDIVDLVWRNGEGFPVSGGIVPLLKQSAIDKDLHSASIQKVA